MNWRTATLLTGGLIVLLIAAAFFLRAPPEPVGPAPDRADQVQAPPARTPTPGPAATFRGDGPAVARQPAEAPALKPFSPPLYRPTDARTSKILPPAGAPTGEWLRAIDSYRTQGNAMALFAIVEARPGASPEEQAELQRHAVGALAVQGETGRPYLEDLLDSPERDTRLAAINAFIRAFPAEEKALIARLEQDPDPVFQAKAEALRTRRR